MSKRDVEEIHKNFVNEWLVNGQNGTRAYMKAFASSEYDSCRTEASKLLARPNIKAIIDERRKEIAEQAKITKDQIVEHLKTAAFLDPTQLFNEDGTAKAPHQLDKDVARVLNSIQIDERMTDNGGELNLIDRKTKYTAMNKEKSLDMLVKMLGYNEAQKIEVSGFKINIPEPPESD